MTHEFLQSVGRGTCHICLMPKNHPNHAVTKVYHESAAVDMRSSSHRFREVVELLAEYDQILLSIAPETWERDKGETDFVIRAEDYKKLRQWIMWETIVGDPPYQTLPWVAAFLNRRSTVVEEMKAEAKAIGQGSSAERLLDWAKRLEVPEEPKESEDGATSG